MMLPTPPDPRCRCLAPARGLLPAGGRSCRIPESERLFTRTIGSSFESRLRPEVGAHVRRTSTQKDAQKRTDHRRFPVIPSTSESFPRKRGTIRGFNVAGKVKKQQLQLKMLNSSSSSRLASGRGGARDAEGGEARGGREEMR